MSRVYATREDTGKRFLVELECDGNGCAAAIKPSPDIARSGWAKRGFRWGQSQGEWTEFHYCPSCAAQEMP